MARQLNFFKLLNVHNRYPRVREKYQKPVPTNVVFRKVVDYATKPSKGAGGDAFFPWHLMEVNEGFIVENYPHDASHFRHTLDKVMRYHLIKTGVKKRWGTFTTQTGVKCWRKA